MDYFDDNLSDKRNTELKENSIVKFGNSRKRSRESIDEDISQIINRRVKLENYEVSKPDEYSAMMPIELIQNAKKLETNRSINSTLYDHTNKNDVLNIIWKITAQKEDFLSNNQLVLSENFYSKRNDGWFFRIDHSSPEKNSGGQMRVSVKCVDEKSYNQDDSYLAKIFKGVNFEVELSFQLINYKTQNFTIKNLNYNNVESKCIPIPNDFYSSNPNGFYSSTRSSKNVDKNEDKVTIILEISIHKNFSHLINNKEITGLTGIVNEAATCYMNSMIQTLNIFGSFKRAVFQIPTADEDYHSVALSLQRLFYDLMTDSNPVTTNRLVKSFGWGREQMLIQHDVQEFNILLADIMEKKMKGTPSEGTFNKLFAGTLNNYIQCVNVDYKSNKEEKFTDLQLTVKGCKDIYQSLNSYTEEEILDNADKYYAEGYGKQKAKKGIKFIKFPSVLIIQLKRFEYNPKREAMVKINDYFEFYEEIDLGRYLVKPLFNEINEDNKYSLHSVVVHQGNANSGHYYAYIRPTLKDFWIQYNDEIVKPADKYEVFKNNYGGNYKSYKHKTKGEIITNTNSYESNAYILVYIKNSERENILNQVNPVDIPISLRNRFENEKNDDRKIQLKKLRMTENINIILITKENVMSGVDNSSSKLGIVTSYADLDKSPPLIMNKYSRLLINFPRTLTLSQFLQFISLETNIPIKLMKLYEYESGNTSFDTIIKYRSDYELIPIDQEGLKRNMIELTNNYKKHIVSLFLHINDQTDKLKILKTNTQKSNEEYKIGEKLVLISREINRFTFNLNNQTNSTFNLIQNDLEDISSEYYNDKNSKIIFIKEFNRTTNSFIITKILDINYSSKIDFQDFIDLLQSNLTYKYQDKLYFIIERTSLPGTNELNIILTAINYQDLLEKTSSLIIIPFQENEDELFTTKLNEMYNTIYIDLYCPSRKSYVKNKLALNLKTCEDEQSIKRNILSEIKSKNLFGNFIELSHHFLIDQNKTIHKIENSFLQNIIEEDNIDLYQGRESNPRFILACRETPLLKYLNQTDCRIDLNINLFVKQAIPEAFCHDISLFDINSHKICVLSVIFPKKIKRCREVIEYLYDIVLTNQLFYKDMIDRENFFFILQNPGENYIYQLLVDNNCEMLKYEGNAEKIEYRLQPFRKETIDCFYDADCKKIFVSFLTSGIDTSEKIKIEPVVLYVAKGTKLFELKFLISEHLKKTNYSDLFNSCKFYLKFYSSSIENSKIKKDLNLQHYKEDDLIENILKDLRIYNILTEIVFSAEK